MERVVHGRAVGYSRNVYLFRFHAANRILLQQRNAEVSRQEAAKKQSASRMTERAAQVEERRFSGVSRPHLPEGA